MTTSTPETIVAPVLQPVADELNLLKTEASEGSCCGGTGCCGS